MSVNLSISQTWVWTCLKLRQWLCPGSRVGGATTASSQSTRYQEARLEGEPGLEPRHCGMSPAVPLAQMTPLAKFKFSLYLRKHNSYCEAGPT